jgi:ribonuclease/clavin/mitogillin
MSLFMKNKIIDAVSLILVHKNEIFAMRRQNYLRAFPGYWAFPGGKVDADEKELDFHYELFDQFDKKLMSALVRETQEELNLDLIEQAQHENIESIHQLGLAITPDFNPYRYAAYFFKVTLKEKPKMHVDENEAAFADWLTGDKLMEIYNNGQMLAVPPVIKTYQRLAADTSITEIKDLDFVYDSEKNVPMIESVKGLYQAMPLSFTLPPANRTNCFVIGDPGENVLVLDPSPKDEQEYTKLINTIKPLKPTHVFITHHHSDHVDRADKLARELSLPMMMSQYTLDRLSEKKGLEFFNNIRVQVVGEGDLVTRWLEREVLVYEVPGHDEGQLAIAPKSMEWFIAGDLFQGIGTVVIGTKEGSMKKYFATLEKVIQLGPQVVFPSHGIGLGGTNILEKTLEHRKLREKQVIDLKSQGLNNEQILQKIYFDIPEPLKPYAMANIESHIKKLEEENRL